MTVTKEPIVPGQVRSPLAQALSMGPVELNVRDVHRLRRFYAHTIGLRVLNEDDRSVVLGWGERPVVILHDAPDLPSADVHDTGLYHMAMLFSSQAELARAVLRMLSDEPSLFAGSADHLVSEAFYFSDPEGNGIELYYDRDPATWKWQNGMVQMGSLYLPPQEYVLRYAAEEAEEGDIRIGHVHLKVGDIAAAEKFYADIVGFTPTATMPNALFVSVNGYHHHLGMNTWESNGARGRGDTLGLKQFSLLLPQAKDIADLQKQLEAHRVPVQKQNHALSFADPWNNKITVALQS